MARDEDDDRPVAKMSSGFVPVKDFAPLSVQELETYIQTLETEIARTRGAIEAKRSHRSGAEGLFKR